MNSRSEPSPACVLRSPGPIAAHPLRLEKQLPKTPAQGEVLLEVSACGVCRTDLQIVQGELPAHQLPIVPGHQIVGRIVELGAGVNTLQDGERVGLGWLAEACGKCDLCRSGRENLCRYAHFTGWDRDGGFARYTTARASMVFPIPEGFADLNAAPLLCGGVIGYRSLKRVGIGPEQRGKKLGLFGFGASALIALQVAKSWGCRIFVCTRSALERARARELGADWVGGYDEQPPEPLDAAVTFAPAGHVVIAALRACDRGATVAINAIHLDRMPDFSYDDLWWERSLVSVSNYTRKDAIELLRLAAEIPIQTRFEVFDLKEANLALERLSSGEIRGAAVLRVRP